MINVSKITCKHFNLRKLRNSINCTLKMMNKQKMNRLLAKSFFDLFLEKMIKPLVEI